MVKVGARVIFTTFAIAVRFEWREIVSEFGVLDVNTAVLSIKGAVSRHASRADAVKGVATKFGADE